MSQQTTDEYTDFDRIIEEEGGVPEVAEVLGETNPPKRNRQGAHLIGKGGPGRLGGRAKPYTSRSTEEAGPADTPLYNESDIQNFAKGFVNEKYEHRIVAFLKAQGRSNKEIAELTGYHQSYVSQILRLPWVKDVIIDEIKRAGREEVQEILQASAVDSVLYLIETRDDTNAAHKDRIAAAKELLNRTYGAANQVITVREEVDMSKLSDAELAKIAARGRN